MSNVRETLVVKGKLYTVGVFGLVGLLVVCYTVIATLGGDTGSYLSFAAPISTSLLALMVISKQIDDIRSDNAVVKDKLETVEHQTNGALADQFADLKEHINDKIGGN